MYTDNLSSIFTLCVGILKFILYYKKRISFDCIIIYYCKKGKYYFIKTLTFLFSELRGIAPVFSDFVFCEFSIDGGESHLGKINKLHFIEYNA